MKERTQSARVKGIVKRVKESLPKKVPRQKSYSEKVVTAFFKEQGIPEPEFEYKFHRERKWRFDLSWKSFHKEGYKYVFTSMPNLAIEVQGGIWTAGRHNRGAAMLKEWEKLNEAAAMGWRILYIQPCDLCTTQFAQTIKRALNL